MSLGAYEIFQAESAIPDPVWPELTFQEISRIAFKDRLIAGPDHPVSSGCAVGDVGSPAVQARRGRRF